MALLLEICNQVGYHSQAVHEGRWQRSEDFCFWDHPLMELAGKTMGIIGYGRIGQATARLAEAFGMDVIVPAADRAAPGIRRRQMPARRIRKRTGAVCYMLALLTPPSW